METFDYMKEAALTASTSFHGEKVGMKQFVNVALAVVVASEQLDTIKKALFYGKDSEFVKSGISLGDWNMLAAPQQIANGVEPTQDEADIIHAIIGKVTEAGELMSALVALLTEGKELDVVNIREEVGDGLWYDAMLLKAIGSNFGEAQRINIEKLRARFPNKFTEFDANNRNLGTERNILEKD